MLKMAERGQQYREERLDTMLAFEYADRRLGMVLGFGGLLLLVPSATIIAVYVNKVAGIGLITAAVIGAMVKPFINGRDTKPSLAGKTQQNSEVKNLMPKKAKGQKEAGSDRHQPL